MKVIALNGSPDPNGNTKKALELVAKELEKENIEVEYLQLGGKLLYGCQGCGGCKRVKDGTCVYGKDGMNEILAKVFAADGLIIGTPTYFSNMTAEVKAFIDRCGMVAQANGNPLRRKPGAAVVVMNRSGGVVAQNGIQLLFGILQMPIATSSSWNVGTGSDVREDAKAVSIFHDLGENMAWLLKNTADTAH